MRFAHIHKNRLVYCCNPFLLAWRFHDRSIFSLCKAVDKRWFCVRGNWQVRYSDMSSLVNRICGLNSDARCLNNVLASLLGASRWIGTRPHAKWISADKTDAASVYYQIRSHGKWTLHCSSVWRYTRLVQSAIGWWHSNSITNHGCYETLPL